MRASATSRRIALLVALLELALPVLGLAADQDSYAPPGGAPSMAARIHGKAGGWGIMTPLLVAGVGIYKHVRGEEDFGADSVLNREVVGGVAGDFLTVALMSRIAPALPLPPIFKTALVIGAGFVGWEVGSGNLPDTDWTNLIAQVATATAIQVGLTAAGAALGVSLGGLPTLLASMAGAIAVGILLDRLRDDPESEASSRAHAPYAARDPPEAAATVSAGSGPAPEEDRRDLYRRLREALSRGERERASGLWEDYRSLAPAASSSAW